MGTLDQVLTEASTWCSMAMSSAISCQQWEASAIKITSRSTYPNDTWHHVVCTYDGSSRSSGFKLYVDGVEAPFRRLAR